MKKILPLLVLLLAYLFPSPGASQENRHPDQDVKMCGEPAPPVEKQKPPRTPLEYVLKDALGRQKLSLIYSRAGSVDFDLRRTGLCERNERGTAVLKPCWWLGVETEEDDAGEAYAVQDYVYERPDGCTMYLRIAEDSWQSASLRESSACSKSCPASTALMHRKR